MEATHTVSKQNFFEVRNDNTLVKVAPDQIQERIESIKLNADMLGRNDEYPVSPLYRQTYKLSEENRNKFISILRDQRIPTEDRKKCIEAIVTNIAWHHRKHAGVKAEAAHLYADPKTGDMKVEVIGSYVDLASQETVQPPNNLTHSVEHYGNAGVREILRDPLAPFVKPPEIIADKVQPARVEKEAVVEPKKEEKAIEKRVEAKHSPIVEKAKPAAAVNPEVEMLRRELVAVNNERDTLRMKLGKVDDMMGGILDVAEKNAPGSIKVVMQMIKMAMIVSGKIPGPGDEEIAQRGELQTKDLNAGIHQEVGRVPDELVKLDARAASIERRINIPTPKVEGIDI